MVIANKLDDPKLAKAAWGDLAFAISNTVPNIVRKNLKVVVTPKADEKALPGATVFSWQIGASPWAPGFVVKDDFIYFSGNPESLVKAAKLPAAKFEANAKFAKLIETMGAPAYSGLSFDDLAESAETKTKAIDETWSMVIDRARAAGLELPAKLLPSLEEVKPLLSPAGSASWADEKGFYSVERSPFPLSSLAYGYSGADQMTTVGASALGISVLLPSLNKARETANRVKGASNLKQIGMGCMMYAADNNGAAPADLGVLLPQGLTVDVFVSPSSDTKVPDNIRDGTLEQQAAWVKENSDFVYVKPANKVADAGPDMPLAYEKVGIHGHDGINILYGDGHVEFQQMKTATDIIQQSTGAKPVEFKRPTKAGK
jgi:prepilin-type processing-associated H-X9-DG protein